MAAWRPWRENNNAKKRAGMNPARWRLMSTEITISLPDDPHDALARR